MIYLTLRRIFRYAIHQYFSEIQVLHKERIPTNRPIMILPNHRSAFMDPIVVSTLLKPEMHFLARGESFSNKFMSKIYGMINMIPIYRKAYSPTEVHKNDDVFKYCYDLLEAKGALMIYPEGLCQTQFILSPLKTGAARIALGAEKKNDYQLGLLLIPIGINYTNPHQFRGRVVLDVGEPISVADYKNQYENDSEQAVHELTARLQTDLTNLIITLNDDQDIKLIRQTELLLGHCLVEAEKKSESWYETRRIIAGGINHYRNANPLALNAFDLRVTKYLKLAGIHVSKTTKLPDMFDDLGIKGQFMKYLFLIITLPFYLIGIVTHILPFLITRNLALALVKRKDFTGSVMLSLGLLVFSIFGLAETYLIYKYTTSWFFTVVFFLIWPTLGLFNYSYYVSAFIFLKKRKMEKKMKNAPSLQKYLADERSSILQLLTNAFKEYQEHISTQTN